MNRLAHETSPYLLQHAHNPVDWYPWGEEALARAQAEDRPILLSIGYSACHWCHVMERESFTNEEIAALMNAEFVCIKVDREERPDLDAIYMMAVQLLTRRGGWPMTVFLTPQGVPFYGGTYFPPEDRQGLPGFPKVLRNVAEAYRNRREQVLQGTDRLMAALEGQLAAPPGPRYALDVGIPDAAIQGLQRRFDAANGGFGPMPKFPQPMTLDFLLRAWRRSGDPAPRKMLEVTLTKMAHGGIYDHLGGGFHRYAVDGRWLVPHFEKMLYDNALLSLLYLHAYQAFGQPEYRRVAEETLDYVQRDMTSPEGAFYASEDADSEGEEGKFYIWRAEEIEAALGPADARLLGRYYGVFEGPNFEGQNILYMPRDPDVTTALAMATPEQMAEAVARGRAALQALRNQRVRPARDDKALAAWNGLMLRSFAQAAGALGRADYRETALSSGMFIMTRLYHDGRLYRTYRDGQAKLNGYLADYGAVGNGLLDLWELTFDPFWFMAAREMAQAIMTHFVDEKHGGFFDTSDDHEKLVVRPKELQDNAVPSGGALATELLLRLALLCGAPDYHGWAVGTLQLLVPQLAENPQTLGHWLGALEFELSSPRGIAISGDPEAADTRALLEAVRRNYVPGAALAVGLPNSEAAALVALLADRPQVEGRATAYVCHDFICEEPVTAPAALREQLRLD